MEADLNQFENYIDPRRKELAADRYRPLYHYQPPANWMNDPNGTIFWNGWYHLFYQHRPYDSGPPNPADGSCHWGHAASKDLIHWTDLPVALAPTPEGPDNRGCASGNTVINEGVPTLIYYGIYGGICTATSDDDMITWEKSPYNPCLLYTSPSPRD